MKYKPVIGLEVHVELNTKSKMFCGCSAQYFGEEPNTHTCPVCLGLPGALPVPNQKAIEWCIMIGIALNCEIPLFAKFDRKNYFYPDLPKGYQISQYDQPFAINGKVVIARSETTKQSHKQEIATLPLVARDDEKTIRIRRVHMEEDTAKLIHQFGTQNSKLKTPACNAMQLAGRQNYEEKEKFTLIDFNRSGVPLVEIVTEPDFENAQEVKEYLQKLQQIIRYLEVSTADMEEGQMRLEPNISIRNTSEVNLPLYKVEVKNINSFRFVEKAINFEIERQQKILESGKIPAQETRGWDEKKQITYSQRTKEEAMDYRYFPEPDIPPFVWTQNQISNIKNQIEELPEKKLERFIKQYGLSEYNAEILTREKELADYFEETISVNQALKTKKEKSVEITAIANWIINKKVNIQEILPAQLISQILSSIQTMQVDEKELIKEIKQVLSENTKAVEDYKKGKKQILGFFIAQVKQKVGQKAAIEPIKKLLQEMLQ